MILKKVCVAIDSFKGCLSSSEAGDAAREAIHRLLPDCEVLCFPIADGGEGLLETIVTAANGRYVNTRAHDPLSRLIDTRYALSADGQTAYIEMAAISGLPLLRPEERNPWETTTYGTGELIREALDRGCRHFVVGIRSRPEIFFRSLIVAVAIFAHAKNVARRTLRGISNRVDIFMEQFRRVFHIAQMVFAFACHTA